MIGSRAAYAVRAPDCARANPLTYGAPFPVALEQLAELGYGGVELQVRDPSELRAGQLRTQLDAHGLTAVALATGHLGAEDGLRLDAADDVRRRAVERLVAVIDLAAELDALVTIGSVRGAPEDAAARATVRAAIGTLASHAAHVGVRLVLEPQNRYIGPYLRTVEEVALLLREQGWEAVGIVADAFHMYLEERSLVAPLVRAREQLWHVQLAENHRGPLGTGMLPLRSVLETLDAIGYRGWVVMEHDQGRASRVAAARSLRALRVASAGLSAPPT